MKESPMAPKILRPDTGMSWHEDMSDRAMWTWIGLILIAVFIAGFICGAVLA